MLLQIRDQYCCGSPGFGVPGAALLIRLIWIWCIWYDLSVWSIMCGVFFVIYMGVVYLGKVYQVWFPCGFIGLSCIRCYVHGRG